MTQAVREFGKDFKKIAEIIGTKNEMHIKNYFLQNYDKMGLSHLVNELNEETGNVDSDDDRMIVEESADHH